jgi:hypothetical protein
VITFPEALKTPAYKTWLGGAMGVFIAFFLCYGGLHLMFFTTKWLERVAGGQASIIKKTLIFCIGIGFIVSSYSPAFDDSHNPTSLYRSASGASIKPLPFALGLAICIISGVVLFKAIRDYLAEPKN